MISLIIYEYILTTKYVQKKKNTVAIAMNRASLKKDLSLIYMVTFPIIYSPLHHGKRYAMNQIKN